MRYSRDFRARQPGGLRTLTQQLLSALGRYPGSSLYVHGAGVVSGIQAGNWLFSNATTAATVDNPVGRIDDVRGGVPALQDTTQKKVTLRRGLINSLLWSRDYAQTQWGKFACSIAWSGVTAPDGSPAQKIVEDSTSGTHRLQQIVTVPPSLQTIAAVLKAWERSRTQVTMYDGPSGITRANAIFDLFSGSVVSTTAGAPSIAPLGDGWYLCAISTLVAISAGNNNAYCWVHPAVGSSVNYAGDGTSGILINRSALFQGAVTAQQIIEAGGIPITTTASASSATGPWAQQFDGADDSFGTTLTPGNAGFVCVGANFYDNNLRTILGAGAGATTGDAGVWLSRNAGNLTLYTSDGASRQSVSAAYPIGTNAVASAGWSADSMLVGANNTEATAAKTLNCATASKQMAIGMMTAAGSTAGMLGTLGGAMIIVPALPSPSDRALMRRWVGNLYGVKL